ncbi:MAG TPA: low temperature requirement protein A [Pseudolysinimonas sp.]|nr:low temperature requirement protein A [Pseudolysinimonas sp.]
MSVERLPVPGRLRLRRAVGRDPHGRRQASPLELLFDLTFVVAFTQAGDQLSHYLALGQVGTAIGGFAFILISVCWAWVGYTWFASAFDTDDWLQRVLTMVQMVGVVILALGVPAVFASIHSGHGIDFRLVAAGYVVMRVSMVAMWVRVARHDPQNRRTATLYIVFTAGAQLGWVVLAAVRPQEPVVLVPLIVGLWIVELCGPVVATWDSGSKGGEWGGTPWNAAHIAERYGLLVIITLGEGILGTIAAVAAFVNRAGWSGEAVLITVAGVGLTLGLWWTYFIFPSGVVLARHRNRKWAWSYGHIALFGAIAAVGAGLDVAAYAAEGRAAIDTTGVVLCVAVPVLIFCLLYFVLWSVLFRAVDPFHVGLAAGMVAVLVFAVVLATAGVPLGWCLLVVMASPAVVAVGYETGGYRHVEADIRREAS